MSIAGNQDLLNNAPNYMYNTFGKTGANTYQNTTINAFLNSVAEGVFAANSTQSGHGVAQGWNSVIQYSGYVNTASVTVPGSLYANGLTFTVSGGTVNAHGYLTTNATGNAVSATLTSVGAGFTNTKTVTLDGIQSLLSSYLTVNTAGAGYSNTDYALFANGTVNGSVMFVTNATGSITSINTASLVYGLWLSTTTNSLVSISFKAANGASSNGTGAVFNYAIGPGTGATVTVTLGGRAGRISVEPLIAMGNMTNTSGVAIP